MRKLVATTFGISFALALGAHATTALALEETLRCPSSKPDKLRVCHWSEDEGIHVTVEISAAGWSNGHAHHPGDVWAGNSGLECACAPDADGDLVADSRDGCPEDAAKVEPGICGCGAADLDGDSDGTPDCFDDCPLDGGSTAPGVCGCGIPETDTDADQVPDCQDGCPEDALKIEPGQCGCGEADTDSDGDTIPDCNDAPPGDVHVCGAAEENGYTELVCDEGMGIVSIEFASYGLPVGECGSFEVGSCHAEDSLSLVEDLCVGQPTCLVGGGNGFFGDPCFGTVKRLRIEAVCAPIGADPGQTCARVAEWAAAELRCPAGETIQAIDFASFGTPVGTCSGGFALGECHAPSSQAVVEAACLGQASCRVDARSDVFGGDPCSGTYKGLFISARCGSSP